MFLLEPPDVAQDATKQGLEIRTGHSLVRQSQKSMQLTQDSADHSNRTEQPTEPGSQQAKREWMPGPGRGKGGVGYCIIGYERYRELWKCAPPRKIVPLN